MNTNLLFVNPFAVKSQLVSPELDDRMAETEHGLGRFIQAKLGKEAYDAYYAVVNAIVVNMANDKDVITDEATKKEITEAWQELGKVQGWLKAQGCYEQQPA